MVSIIGLSGVAVTLAWSLLWCLMRLLGFYWSVIPPWIWGFSLRLLRNLSPNYTLVIFEMSIQVEFVLLPWAEIAVWGNVKISICLRLTAGVVFTGKGHNIYNTPTPTSSYWSYKLFIDRKMLLPHYSWCFLRFFLSDILKMKYTRCASCCCISLLSHFSQYVWRQIGFAGTEWNLKSDTCTDIRW